jgi:hypothetical protein
LPISVPCALLGHPVVVVHSSSGKSGASAKAGH